MLVQREEGGGSVVLNSSELGASPLEHSISGAVEVHQPCSTENAAAPPTARSYKRIQMIGDLSKDVGGGGCYLGDSGEVGRMTQSPKQTGAQVLLLHSGSLKTWRCSQNTAQQVILRREG